MIQLPVFIVELPIQYNSKCHQYIDYYIIVTAFEWKIQEFRKYLIDLIKIDQNRRIISQKHYIIH